MASGWWSTTHENLDEVSPADFTLTTGPVAPRGYPKLASIATGGGLYLGGRPCVVVDDIIYYAGDDYTQDSEAPFIARYDGRISTTVVDITSVGGTPAKAILSMVADHNGNIYISTWDAGTSATTFSGRVFKYSNEGVFDTFGDDVFSAGKLPYTLMIADGYLWVGMMKQDPTKSSAMYSIRLTDETTTLDHRFITGNLTDPTVSTSRLTDNYTYYVTGVGGAGESGRVSAQVTNDHITDATTFNTITWVAPTTSVLSAPTSAPTASGGSSPPLYNIYYMYLNSSSIAYHSPVSPASAATVSPFSFTCSGAYSTNPHCAYIAIVISQGPTWTVADDRPGFVFANNPAGGTWSTGTLNITGSFASNNVANPSGNTSGVYDVSYYNIYRASGGATQGKIGDTSLSGGLTFIDDGDAGNGAVAPTSGSTSSPASAAAVATNPTGTTSYIVTALNGLGETAGGTATLTARTTLSATHYVTVSWTAVPGATGYNVYRTAGHTTQGKIVSNTALLTVDDTGLAASGSAPAEDSTGTVIGGIGVTVDYNDSYFVGLYQTTGQFATVQERNASGGWSTSDTIAPGGSAVAYNGYTAGVTYNGNMYMAYWNNDGTPITIIRKFDGLTWTTVKTLTGGLARPIIAFCEVSDVLYAYGGGDGQTGILYSTPNGITWTSQTSLLPSTKEAIPFMASANVLGGF